MNSLKGYKAMNQDMTCRKFKFKVGKVYETDSLKMCEEGFHFCANVLDVYEYYPKSPDTVVCEVEVLGYVLTDGTKSVTNKIKVLRKLSDKDLLKIWIDKTNAGYGNSGDRNSGYGNSGDGNSGDRNSGDWNSGNRNSGDRNSGDWNSGNRNSGDRNSGDWNSGDGNSGDRNSGYGNSGYGNSGYANSGYGNSGDRNSGYGNSGDRNSGDWNSGNRNSGDRNSGDWNSGNRNSGYGNSGDWNSGDWNSGDRNSGYFNTETPLYFFNKPSDLKYTPDLEAQIRSLNVKPVVEWVSADRMSDQEKAEHPTHKVTGGFLRKTPRHDWSQLTEENKSFIRSLPNFDDVVFQKISGGVSLSDDVEVTVNGVVKKIPLASAKVLGLV